jgi:hypothetical protein
MASFGKKMENDQLVQAVVDYVNETGKPTKLSTDALHSVIGGKSFKLAGAFLDKLEPALLESGYACYSPDNWENEIVVFPAPTAKSGDKKFVKFGEAYQEEEKPAKPKGGGKPKEEPEESIEDEINSLKWKGLAKFVEKHGLDLDIEDMKDEEMKLKEVRKAVLDAYNEAQKDIGSGADLPSSEDVMGMKKKQLKQLIKDHDLDVDPDDYSSTKKLAKAIDSELEEIRTDGEDKEEEKEEDDVPTSKEILAMKKKQLTQVIEDFDLDVDADDYSSTKKLAKAIDEELEEIRADDEDE